MVAEAPVIDVLVKDQADRDLMPMYEIIMWDDDRTSMDSVVKVLTEFLIRLMKKPLVL